MNRIIVTGKNSELPRLAEIPVGVGVDGTPFFTKVTLPPNVAVCRVCDGAGRRYYEAGYQPWERAGWETCKCCEGSGRISIEETCA